MKMGTFTEPEETLAAQYSDRVDGLREEGLLLRPDALLGDPPHDVPVDAGLHVQLDAGDVEAIYAVEEYDLEGGEPVQEDPFPRDQPKGRRASFHQVQLAGGPVD